MKRLLLACLLLLSRLVSAQQTEIVPTLDQFFTDAGVRGVFVLYAPEKNLLKTNDEARARRRYIPYSTFKIPNSLIGLEIGAVKSVDEMLPYGGKPQPFPTWEHDMPLREAIKLSSVPIYQELARRVGSERMAEKVKAFRYGNMETGSVVDRFWLDGPLQISAVEQTDFLARLVGGKLPVSATAKASVEEITLREMVGDCELHHKTGWSGDPAPQLGWIVGWIKTMDGKFYPFALNLDATSDADIPKRLTIAKQCLHALGITKED